MEMNTFFTRVSKLLHSTLYLNELLLKYKIFIYLQRVAKSTIHYFYIIFIFISLYIIFIYIYSV